MSVYSKDFMLSKPTDVEFSKVSMIICSPMHSGSAIKNKHAHFLQENGMSYSIVYLFIDFYNEHISDNEKLEFKIQNILQLRHAFSCKFTLLCLFIFIVPSVNSVVFTTHSIFPEENEDVVKDLMQTLVGEEWYLECVLPDETNENINGLG